VNKAKRTIEIAISAFDPAAGHLECLGTVQVRGYEAGRVEKNWCFFEQSDRLYCLLSVAPQVVIARLVSLDRLEFEVFRRYPSVRLFEHLDPNRYISVSTAPLVLNDVESLFLVHQSDLKIIEVRRASPRRGESKVVAARLEKYTRKYRHYGVKVRRHDLGVSAVTARPVLTRPEPRLPQLGITFVLSGVRLGDEFLYGFGEDDRRGKLLSFEKNDLDRMNWVKFPAGAR
jgi:hypothetical protein